MPEYIEREALIKTTRETPFTMSMCLTVEECKGMNRAREILADIFEILPAADVAPVIRCERCDNWNEWDHSGHKSLGNFRCSCAYWTVEDGPTFYTAPTDFCSYAEPRDPNEP